jgi:hypothetical protein
MPFVSCFSLEKGQVMNVEGKRCRGRLSHSKSALFSLFSSFIRRIFSAHSTCTDARLPPACRAGRSAQSTAVESRCSCAGETLKTTNLFALTYGGQILLCLASGARPKRAADVIDWLGLDTRCQLPANQYSHQPGMAPVICIISCFGDH